MKSGAKYYVYAYFDPRNYEMLYVGKGKGSRKFAHQPHKAGTDKEQRLHEIRRAGLEPLIRVVAANLTEDQAYLVEKALIWRSGRWLTNISSGKFAENFRPPDTLHLSLPGFDSERGLFFVNVGDHFGPHRQWEDGYKYNFVAAGYGREASTQLDRLSPGDVIAAYLVPRGYVGIGQVVARAVPAVDFRFKGRTLRPSMLKGPELLHDKNDAEQCEYLVGVKWIKKVKRQDARFRSGSGLWVARRIVADMSNQLKTQQFLEQQFGVSLKRLLASE